MREQSETGTATWVIGLLFTLSLAVGTPFLAYAVSPEQMAFIRNYQSARSQVERRQLARGLDKHDLYAITIRLVDEIMYMRCRNENEERAPELLRALAEDYTAIYQHSALRMHVQGMLRLPHKHCRPYIEAKRRNAAARRALKAKQIDAAINKYKGSLSLARMIGNKEHAIEVLNELIAVEIKRERPHATLSYVTEAELMLGQVAYPNAGLAVMCNAGKANNTAGSYLVAVSYYERCLDEAEKTTLPARAKFLPYTGLTEAHAGLKDKQGARRYWDQMLQTRPAQPASFFFNSAIHTAVTVGNHGDVALARTIVNAIKGYAEKTTLSDMERFVALGQIAGFYQGILDAPSSKRYALRARAQAKAIGNEQAFASASLVLAYANLTLDKPTEALNCLKESYQYIEQAPASYIKLDTMRMIAEISFRIGETEQWQWYITKAYEGAVAAKLHPQSARLALQVAEKSILMDKPAQAATYIDKVVSGEVPADPRYQAIAYAMHGRLLRSEGKPELALSKFLSALRLQTRAGLLNDEAVTLLSIAKVYTDLQNTEEARRYLQRVNATILKQDSRLADVARTVRARIAEAAGHLDESIEIFAGVYERQRKRAYAERFSLSQRPTLTQAEFRANTLAYTEMLLRAAEQSPKPDHGRRAFVVTEQGKSINFQKLLSRYLQSKSRSLDKDTRAKVQALNALLLKKQELESKDRHLQAIRVLGGQEDIREIDDKMKSLSDEIQQSFPGLVEQTEGIETVADVQRLLKSDEAIVSYSIRPEHSGVFVVTPENLHYIGIPLGKTGIREKVAAALNGVRNVVGYEDLALFSPEKAEALYRLLFLPVEQHLKSADKIIVVGDDILNAFPIEMLVTEIRPRAQNSDSQAHAAFLSEYTRLRYLADRHAFIYLPSTSMFVAIRTHAPNALWTRSLVAFADPDFESLNKSLRTIRFKARARKTDLDGRLAVQLYKNRELDLAFMRLKNTRDEALSIARIAGAKQSDLFLGKRATEANVRKASLEHTRFLLFATHGVVPTGQNGLDQPALALAPTMRGKYGSTDEREDGLLTASDIMHLKLSAEAVVLSACDTADSGQKSNPGEGFTGLTRAFMFAGAKNLVVSHWPVESESTRRLMVDFFKRRVRAEKPGHLALNEARKALRAETGLYPDHPSGRISFSHPFFWAPFVWVGAY